MITLPALLIASLFGLAIGSFLNVVVIRGARAQSLRGRSQCESCKRTLSVKELIPVISFLVQKGRCRNCGTALSWQYPIIELFTTLCYLLLALLFLPSFSTSLNLTTILLFAGSLIGTAAIIVILAADFRYQIIPNGSVVILFLLGLAAALLRAQRAGIDSFIFDFVAAFSIALFFVLLWLVSRGRWIGLGDPKLIFSTSLLLGFPASITAFLFAWWSGGIVAIILLLFGKKSLQSRVPFGPFILIGAGLAYLFLQHFPTLWGLPLLF